MEFISSFLCPTFAGELSKRSANIDLQGNFSLSSGKQLKPTEYPSLQPALLEVSPGIAAWITLILVRPKSCLY